MKYSIFLSLIIVCFSFTTNHPNGRPTSIVINNRGEKTYIPFNSTAGAKIYKTENTHNESTVFTRSIYEKAGITDWTSSAISPTMISEDRELAYKYYSDIPGVVWIKKNIFCDETEVSNLDWIEFLQLSNYKNTHASGNPTMKNINYNTAQQFYYFPVVNISYEDAIAYCTWRTKVVTENYNLQKGFPKNSEEYTEFIFRLPSKSEWITCASFGTDTLKFPHIFTQQYIPTKIDSKGLTFLNLAGSSITENDLSKFNKEIKIDHPFNCKRTTDTYLNLEIPYYIWDYPNNNYGIYNIIGNVREMTNEKSISMGAGFRDIYDDCKINKEYRYTTPTDDLGFRCICELKWPNKK